MTPAALAAPALSLLLAVAMGFAFGALILGPSFFRPPPVPAPSPVLPSAAGSHGHPASPSPRRRHRHHRASLVPVQASPVRPSWRQVTPGPSLSWSPSPRRSWSPAPVFSSAPSTPIPSVSTIAPSSPSPVWSGWTDTGSEAP